MSACAWQIMKRFYNKEPCPPLKPRPLFLLVSLPTQRRRLAWVPSLVLPLYPVASPFPSLSFIYRICQMGMTGPASKAYGNDKLRM